MAEHIAMPEEDPINAQNTSFETLDGTGYLNLLNKMDKLSALSSSLSETQNDNTVLELRAMLHLVIGGIKTLNNDPSKPNAIKLAETVIVLLKLLAPSALENSAAEDELISNIGEDFHNSDSTIQNQNIRKIIETRLGILEVDHQFIALKKHIARLGR